MSAHRSNVILLWIFMFTFPFSDCDDTETKTFLKDRKLIYPPGKLVWLDKSPLTINVTHITILGILAVVVHVLGYFGFTLGLGTTGKRSLEESVLPTLVKAQNVSSGSTWYPFATCKERVWGYHFVHSKETDFRCFYRWACDNPDLGQHYLHWAKIMWTLINAINRHGQISDWTMNFCKTSLDQLKNAVEMGKFSELCERSFPCNELRDIWNKTDCS